MEVAQVAARLMAEEGVPGFAEAKSRAADRLGVHGRQVMPRNDEIEAELRAYQALFQADEQPVWLARMRRVALEVMDLLEPFGPRLVGSVLRGTAAREAEVTLHVFAETPEAVASFLYDRNLRWELDAWVGRFGGDRQVELPMYRIGVAGHASDRIPHRRFARGPALARGRQAHGAHGACAGGGALGRRTAAGSRALARLPNRLR